MNDIEIRSQAKRIQSSFNKSFHCRELLVQMHVPRVHCLRHAVVFLRFLRMLQKRGVGSGEQGTSTGNGWMKNGNKRIGNEVNDRARVQVRFCSHFSFSRCPCSFLAARFSNILLPRKLLGQEWLSNVWSARHRWRCEHPVAKSFDNHVYFSEKNFKFATLIKFYW